MNLVATAPVWLVVTFAALLAAAAAEDAWRLRISNLTCLLILFAAIAAAWLAGPSWVLWQNAAVFFVLLAVGMPMFSLGKLGGGDVKLLAVCGAWFNLRSGGIMLIYVLLAGGVLAMLILTLRAVGRGRKDGKGPIILNPGSGIPYGVAIAAGTLLMLR